MHISLTDRISCPGCGPGIGLILFAHEVRERRVLEGDLGCSSCRETYPVRRGFVDLRLPPRTPIGSSATEPGGKPGAEPSDPEEVLRLGALLGVTEGPGTLLIKGPAARFASGLVELIGGIEVVGLDPGLLGQEESEGVTRMVSHPRIPFFSDSFRGILLSGKVGEGDVEEAVRVVAPSGRVVILDASLTARGQVEALGLSVLLLEEGVLVAQHEQARSVPLVTLRGL